MSILARVIAYLACLSFAYVESHLQVLQSALSSSASLLSCGSAVQTLWWLHQQSNLCHMDLSPDNIMLRLDKSNPWDTLRLIDFGFAAKFNPGKHRASLRTHVCLKRFC